MAAQDAIIIPPAATTTRRGGLVLGGDLDGSGSTAAAPVLDLDARTPAHTHARLLNRACPILHSNNYAGTIDLYPANSDAALRGGGSYVYVLNEAQAFRLRTDVTDSIGLTSAPTLSLRTPGGTVPAMPEVALGAYRGEEVVGDVTLLLIQDDVGGWTPTFSSYQSTIPLGVTPGSGTAGQWRMFVFRYLGPLVGWRAIYDSGSWQGSFPYTLAPSSTRSGQWVRGVVGNGANAAAATASALDQLVKTPANYRKALYEGGTIIEGMNDGSQSVIYSGNQLANVTNGGGYTYGTLVRNIVCGIAHDEVSTAEVTVHESGHAADFLLGNASRLYTDTFLNSYWQQDKADWLAGGGVDNASGDAQANAGWSGSAGYFVRVQTEWIAQVIGMHMHYKWAVAAADSTAQANATSWFTKAVNPTRRDAVRAYLDSRLAAYIT